MRRQRSQKRRGASRSGGREDVHIVASARGEREAGKGGNVHGEEGVVARTRYVGTAAGVRGRRRRTSAMAPAVFANTVLG